MELLLIIVLLSIGWTYTLSKFFSIRDDYVLWNQGRCRGCHTYLHFIATLESGQRIYRCSECGPGKDIVISHLVDEK